MYLASGTIPRRCYQAMGLVTVGVSTWVSTHIGQYAYPFRESVSSFKNDDNNVLYLRKQEKWKTCAEINELKTIWIKWFFEMTNMIEKSPNQTNQKNKREDQCNEIRNEYYNRYQGNLDHL